MLRELLKSAEGFNTLGIIIMVLFIGIFIGIVIWAVTVKKPYIKKMKDMPLDIPNEGDKQNG